MEHGIHNGMRTCRGRMALEGATNGLPVDAANSEHAVHRVWGFGCLLAWMMWLMWELEGEGVMGWCSHGEGRGGP